VKLPKQGMGWTERAFARKDDTALAKLVREHQDLVDEPDNSSLTSKKALSDRIAAIDRPKSN
jgi:hypothetical protein